MYSFLRFSARLLLNILIIEKCPTLEWQLRSLQSNREVRNRAFGIQYFTIESTGLQIAYNSSVSENSYKKLILNPPATFRGLIVFLCRVSEILCDDFSWFCKDQIISVISKAKIPFILCLNNADNSVFENTIKTVILNQIKKVTKVLQANMDTTHWIVRMEASLSKLPFT